MAEMTLEDLQAALDKSNKELDKVKDESAKRRIALKEANTKIEGMTPNMVKLQEYEDASKSEDEKQQRKLTDLQSKIQDEEKRLGHINFVSLAIAAGVPKEKAEMLNQSSFDLEDEAKMSEQFKAFAKIEAPKEKPLNPNREEGQLTTDEWSKLPLEKRLGSVEKQMGDSESFHSL